jgi:hypothetical protein
LSVKGKDLVDQAAADPDVCCESGDHLFTIFRPGIISQNVLVNESSDSMISICFFDLNSNYGTFLSLAKDLCDFLPEGRIIYFMDKIGHRKCAPLITR